MGADRPEFDALLSGPGRQSPADEHPLCWLACPANRKNKRGKLRLLYEASPLAFIVEQAGGAATDGHERILDIQPTELHQRTPLFIGSNNDVDAARKMLGADAKS